MTLLIGSLGTAAGAWIKVFSVVPDRFYVALIGQTIAAISQVFVLSVPANLAATWFGPDQVSSACSIGVFGNQVTLVVNDAFRRDNPKIDLKLDFVYYSTKNIPYV